MNKDLELVSEVKTQLRSLEYDVNLRNEYMNERDRVIYEDGLFEGLEFNDGTDKTLFNYLSRVVDIHTSQLMGRGFQLYSNYNKDDLSSVEMQEAPDQPGAEGQEQPNPEAAEKLAEAKNKQKQINAETRKKLIDAIIRDNGGLDKFKQGARLGSSYGTTVYKTWWDKAENRYRISLLETPQNYFAGWSDSDFRDRDFDAYVYQISEYQAYKQYGDKLKDGEMFSVSQEGQPIGNGMTNDPINSVNNSTRGDEKQTGRKMVTVIDVTGSIYGWGIKNSDIVQVEKGKETPFNVLIVGDKIVQTITDPDLLPRYWVVSNREVPRRAWGHSDIPKEAIDVNRTLIEVMSTWITLFHKEIAPTYLAKGFASQANIPRRKRKSTTFIPAQLEQSIELVQQPNNYGPNSNQIISELKDSFVRLTGVGRVMFDDPTINPTSNQALLTTLKGVIDIVEDKQTRWEPVLIDMFTDALRLTAKFIPEARDAVNEEGWFLYVRWPSVLRREDATYQQMWLNRFNAGTVSVESYLEAMGTDDVSEEVDRLRDDMKDPVRASIIGHTLSELAAQTVNPPQTQPQPDVKVSLRGDLTPYQEANLASQQGFNDGPFPPTAGPQGNQGLMSQENADNQGFINGNPYRGGTAIQQNPDGQVVTNTPPMPQLTPDQNTGQTASQPGSGATPVSPQGAINQVNQQRGQ